MMLKSVNCAGLISSLTLMHTRHIQTAFEGFILEWCPLSVVEK